MAASPLSGESLLGKTISRNWGKTPLTSLTFGKGVNKSSIQTLPFFSSKKFANRKGSLCRGVNLHVGLGLQTNRWLLGVWKHVLPFRPADTGVSPAAGVEERQALREERRAGGGELSHADGARAIFIVVLLWRKHVALSAARRQQRGVRTMMLTNPMSGPKNTGSQPGFRLPRASPTCSTEAVTLPWSKRLFGSSAWAISSSSRADAASSLPAAVTSKLTCR